MTDGEPETVVSASLQKIKSIKNPVKPFKFIFYFIKSETRDSSVNHFNGHFAYLIKPWTFLLRELHSTTTTKTQYDLEPEEELTAYYAHSAHQVTSQTT